MAFELDCTGQNPIYNMTPLLCYSGICGYLLVILCTVISLAMLFTRQCFQSFKIHPATFYICIIFFVSLCASSSIQLYTLISFGEFYISENPSRNILYLQCIFELIYNISAYIFVITQLYLALKNSQFQLSKFTIYSHILNIIFIVFGNIFRITLYRNNNFTIARSMGSILIFLGFTGLSHMSFLFNRQLYIFIVETHGAQSTLNINMNDTNFANMFKVITKISVLTSIFIAIAMIRIIIGVIDAITGGQNSYLILFFRWTEMIYFFAICACLFLSLSINHQLYTVFCRICDNKCIHLCKSFALRSAKRKIKVKINMKHIAKHMREHIQSTISIEQTPTECTPNSQVDNVNTNNENNTNDNSNDNNDSEKDVGIAFERYESTKL